MTNFDVRAKRWESGWELYIKGVGVTQSRTLWDAEAMALDLIGRREGLERAKVLDVFLSMGIGSAENWHLGTAPCHGARSA